jgi:hypothetical protein
MFLVLLAKTKMPQRVYLKKSLWQYGENSFIIPG